MSDQKQLRDEIIDKIIDLKNQDDKEIIEFVTNFFHPVVDKWSLSIASYGRTGLVFKHSNGNTVYELYFRENYFRSNKYLDQKTFNDAYISYYTTSTQSEFEYDRLEIIGESIKIFRHKHQEFLDAVNDILEIRRNEIDSLYDERSKIDRQILEAEAKEYNNTISEFKQKLMTTGLTFDKARIEYARNGRRSFYVNNIVKAVASKSKPKAVTYKVLLTDNTGHEYTLERVKEHNIQSLIFDSIEWKQLNQEK